MLRGWILDSLADEDENAVVLWLHTGQRVHKIVDRTFQPSLFVHHASLEELRSLQKALGALEGIAETAIEPHRLWLVGPPSPTLRVTFSAYRELRRTASIIDRRGKYRAFGLYNVDVRFTERHFVEHGLFPFAQVRFDRGRFELQDDLDDLSYPLPPLTSATLSAEISAAKCIPRLDDPLRSVQLNDIRLEGSEEEMLAELTELLRRRDPDVLYTMDGDAFLLPYLHHRAQLLGLEGFQLGRDPDRIPGAGRKRRTFTSYGRVIYKPQGFPLSGRLHLDHRSSFLLLESGLWGLIDLARLSALPLQELARLSPGSAINAMEINQALRDGCLVLWKKNRTEDFKSAEDLLRGDRGGFIFEPEVGLHDGLYELDFSSLYPSIMVKYNISPETLDCRCCESGGRSVPELKYHLCTRRIGLIPRVLKPVIERRRYYKKMKREPGPLQEVYAERDTVLKWLLVTCLDGRTVVPYRMGDLLCQKPISEIIDPLLPREGVAEAPSELRLFGYDSALNLVEKSVAKIMRIRSPPRMIRIRLQKGREISTTPNHRFYVLNERGRLDVKRADELRVGDYVPIATELPRDPPRIGSINLAMQLAKKLTGDELFMWRVRGPILRDAISSRYEALLKAGLKRGFTYRTIWLWRRNGIFPLAFLPLLDLRREAAASLEIGRTRLGGGEISFLPCRIEIDRKLAFFLGFYAGDGSGTRNMVRFGVGMTEPEILDKLMDCAEQKFRLRGSVRREKHARMWVLQFNSIALKRILEEVFEMGGSADTGKLVVPPVVLNGGEEVRLGFLEGLIASDGCVAPSRDWARMSTASRRFADSIGLLLATLGLKYVVRCSGRNRPALYDVGFRLRELRGKLWMKRGHRKRAGRFAARDLNRSARIPILESGLFALCRKYKATHSLSRGPGHLASGENVLRRLQRIRKKRKHIPEADVAIIQELERLARSNLAFYRIRSLRDVAPQSDFVYCFEVDEEPNGFIVQGNLFLGNCFGYTGYKNARFGRIECHEAINAYAREILVRSMEIAESHRHEVVHGIVDSLWLRSRPDADDIRTVQDHIAGSIGIPIELEGRYKWIVFLPNKTNKVGALNRYYGLFEDRRLKLRGIELRRHDTPPFLRAFQRDVLGAFSQASDGAGVLARIPEALEILRRYASALRAGEAKPEELVLTKHISQTLGEYVQFNDSTAALRQLRAEGFRVEPGQAVRYVVTDAASRDPHRRVRVAEFLDEATTYDVEAYLRLLARSAETLLAAFGYTEERLLAALNGATPHRTAADIFI